MKPSYYEYFFVAIPTRHTAEAAWHHTLEIMGQCVPDSDWKDELAFLGVVAELIEPFRELNAHPLVVERKWTVAHRLQAIQRIESTLALSKRVEISLISGQMDAAFWQELSIHPEFATVLFPHMLNVKKTLEAGGTPPLSMRPRWHHAVELKLVERYPELNVKISPPKPEAGVVGVQKAILGPDGQAIQR